jgi:hypothetical protein
MSCTRHEAAKVRKEAGNGVVRELEDAGIKLNFGHAHASNAEAGCSSIKC